MLTLPIKPQDLTMRYVFTTKCNDLQLFEAGTAIIAPLSQNYLQLGFNVEKDFYFRLELTHLPVKTLKDFRKLKKQDRTWVLIKNVPSPPFFRF